MTIIGSLECNLSARTLREGTTHYDSMCNALILCLSPVNDSLQIICSIKGKVFEELMTSNDQTRNKNTQNYVCELI